MKEETAPLERKDSIKKNRPTFKDTRKKRERACTFGMSEQGIVIRDLKAYTEKKRDSRAHKKKRGVKNISWRFLGRAEEGYSSARGVTNAKRGEKKEENENVTLPTKRKKGVEKGTLEGRGLITRR